jgi:hypothetical protein
MANIVIHRLEAAQDTRVLTLEEGWLRRTLKHTVLALSSLERTVARQRSRIHWIREGDANTRLFHAVANGRKAKNFIPVVRIGTERVTDQCEKEEAFHQAYLQLLGTIQNRELTLDLRELGMQCKAEELRDLGEIFSEEEVWSIIKEMPPDRAPGPDGFLAASISVHRR